jgi:hypothetical protein
MLTIAMMALACRFSPTATPEQVTGFLPLTAVATRTPPVAPRRSCPVASLDPSTPGLSDPAGAARALEEFLNSGGEVERLEPDELDLASWRPDIDGNGWVDVALVLVRGDPQAPGSHGALHVFRCVDDRFGLVYTASEQPPFGPPQVTHVADLTGDGQQELVVVRQSCGAHTCTADVEVLVWMEGQLRDRFHDSLEEFPFPTIQVQGLEGKSGNILITAGGVQSVGAGPFRSFTRIWEWDSGSRAFRRSGDIVSDSTFRIHVLHDAESAALSGDIAGALAGYQRVIDDGSLRDWVDPERERAVLGAFASFRQVSLVSLAGERDRAGSILDGMRDRYGPGGPGRPYLEMAEAYWLIIDVTGDVHQACLEAQAYASSNRAAILDPLYFGYSNPSYDPTDMCLVTAGS